MRSGIVGDSYPRVSPGVIVKFDRFAIRAVAFGWFFSCANRAFAFGWFFSFAIRVVAFGWFSCFANRAVIGGAICAI